ncbi:MAG: hypothetical protein AAF567_04905 [Actinomycetota bacterium]
MRDRLRSVWAGARSWWASANTSNGDKVLVILVGAGLLAIGTLVITFITGRAESAETTAVASPGVTLEATDPTLSTENRLAAPTAIADPGTGPVDSTAPPTPTAAQPTTTPEVESDEALAPIESSTAPATEDGPRQLTVQSYSIPLELEQVSWTGGRFIWTADIQGRVGLFDLETRNIATIDLLIEFQDRYDDLSGVGVGGSSDWGFVELSAWRGTRLENLFVILDPATMSVRSSEVRGQDLWDPDFGIAASGPFAVSGLDTTDVTRLDDEGNYLATMRLDALVGDSSKAVGDIVYILGNGSNDGEVFRVDVVSGEVRTLRTLRTDTRAVAATETDVWISTADTADHQAELWRLDPASLEITDRQLLLEEIWQLEVFQDMLVSNGLGGIEILEAESGEIIATAGDPSSLGDIIVAGKLLVISGSNVLHVVDLSPLLDSD